LCVFWLIGRDRRVGNETRKAGASDFFEVGKKKAKEKSLELREEEFFLLRKKTKIVAGAVQGK
jgi:hypothetical protein